VFLLFCGAVALLVFPPPTWRAELDRHNLTQTKVLEYGSIPLVSIAFTYTHIWIALWMTFYPVAFFGIWQIKGTNMGLGWQGIVPSKAEKMARTSVRLMTTQLLNVSEVFSRINPDEVVRHMSPVLVKSLRVIIDKAATAYRGDVWHMMPQTIKEAVYLKALEECPTIVRKIFEDVNQNVTEVFDLEHMAVQSLTDDPQLINDIFIRCGYKELIFIRNSGGYMGGFFGVIQMIIFQFYKEEWVLPTFGFVIGAMTNWLALKMIFSPIDPVRVGCFTLQGLFLKRQAEVSAHYATIVATEVLQIERVIESILTGPTTVARMHEILHRHIKEGVDNFSGLPKALTTMVVSEEVQDNIKKMICDEITSSLRSTLKPAEDYAERALDMENTLRTRMSALPSKEFENLLHPVFQEDEWKLVLMGGVLGVVIGIGQVYVLGLR
jgi:uncharacterized membrane protein YheB (UPF0754 family)